MPTKDEMLCALEHAEVNVPATATLAQIRRLFEQSCSIVCEQETPVQNMPLEAVHEIENYGEPSCNVLGMIELEESLIIPKGKHDPIQGEYGDAVAGVSTNTKPPYTMAAMPDHKTCFIVPKSVSEATQKEHVKPVCGVLTNTETTRKMATSEDSNFVVSVNPKPLRENRAECASIGEANQKVLPLSEVVAYVEGLMDKFSGDNGEDVNMWVGQLEKNISHATN